MSEQKFFIQRPDVNPTIYVYKLVGVASHEGYVKVGYTERDVETRVKEQIGASHVPYQILYQDSAMCPDGSCFTDHDVHTILERKRFKKLNIAGDNEWYNCTVHDVKVAIAELKTGKRIDGARNATFKMRPEQYAAVQNTQPRRYTFLPFSYRRVASFTICFLSSSVKNLMSESSFRWFSGRVMPSHGLKEVDVLIR